MRSGPYVLMAVALASGCDEGLPPPAPSGVDAGPPPACLSAGDGIICVAGVAHDCNADGTTASTTDCAADGTTCVPRLGCRTCAPSTVSCEGESVRICDADGGGFEPGPTCDVAAGERCSPSGCAHLCADAAAERSYVGCEYWPVATANDPLSPEFTMAVVVANPQLVPALVTVDRAGATIATTTVPPGELATIPLPWVNALRVPQGSSVRVDGGAFRLTSDVPVTVYQFNPLDYELARDCAEEPPSSPTNDGRCFSYTNDASLLLPTHALSGSYVAISRPTHVLSIDGLTATSPGFVTIVGVDETVSVEVEAAGRVAASSDATIAAMMPGQSASFTLGRGDVLQLVSATPTTACPGETRTEKAGDSVVEYCALDAGWDLTGTRVRATGRVAVISGHACTFVPFDRWACDHLEEAMFPVEAWGRDVVVSGTRPLRGEPNLVRVLSATDANTVRLDPPIRPPVVLGRGEHFEVEVDGDVRVTATAPISVAQLMVGQDWAGIGSSGARPNGDPSMSMAIPTEQLRSRYSFLAPETYAQSFVNVAAPAGARVVLDGRLLTDFRDVGDGAVQTARERIDGGVHVIEGSAPFGIVVYGFGSYTSYLYPGGLDLREISPPI